MWTLSFSTSRLETGWRALRATIRFSTSRFLISWNCALLSLIFCLDRYSDSTFTLTSKSEASATLTFNGTGVWIFGARRSNHGLYNVTLDGSVLDGQNGFAEDPAFQQPLFVSPSLQNIQHSLTISNAGTNFGQNFLDIDFVRELQYRHEYSSRSNLTVQIVWESEIGSDSEQIFDTMTEDTHAAFTYQPDGAWSTDPPDLINYSGGTGQWARSSCSWTIPL